ncbi:MAG TPA: TonB-dependent receptor [Woeseiaceae bacterium]|nr:TonB-dependent receptor [Woeseiaceae bacterium]
MATAQDREAPESVISAPTLPAAEENSGAIEEVVVTGRFLSSSQQLVNERIDDSYVSDVLGEDTISRLGDSTVGAALRRVPGLSLVADKFVYIRGLGERYSATSLNGAQIPSPDLTRNVIPLDVFPTSIVESLKVQKAWSPDLPANFGGGSVDIRTKGIPDAFVLNFEFGSGYNSLAGDGYTYEGGDDDRFGTDDGTRALSGDVLAAINEYQGSVGVQQILTFMRRQDPSATLADAQLVNRDLALELNRNIGAETTDVPLDASARASIGNNWLIGNDWELGFLAGGSYQNEWRNTEARARNFNFPEERTDDEDETTRSTTMAGTGTVGLKFTDDHQIETTSLWLRNTDDETAVRDFFNENRQKSDGLGFRNYRIKFEEREMLTHQISGSHFLGTDTRERLPGFLSGLAGVLPDESSVSWFYSESEAQTDIPNEVSVNSQTVTDPVTGAVQSEAVLRDATAADFRFTDLNDEVINHGWSASLPIEFKRNQLVLGGGYNHVRKARTYRQSQFSIGALAVADPSILRGSLDQVFSDENILDPNNNFVFDRQGSNNESYIAATMTDAAFGSVEWTWNDTWKIATGARWEDYRQVAVSWNPYGYSQANPQVTTDPDVLKRGTFADDEIFPSASVTWMSDLWAETFQLRFGWSETAVRPDLREITEASYVDPVTDDLTFGNPDVEPAAVTNYDVRAEWFFSSGDNLTVSLFRKEIDQPIDFFESPASDTTIAREILNGESAEVQGVEIEGLKELAFLGGFFDTMFVQGNVTLQDSELVSGSRPDAPTNPVRPLGGASEYVANVMLGFDSPDSKHTASLIYNVFGERLYVAGRNGAPDAFEQPFHSLDLTYAWYPTDTMTVKLKAQNLLEETVTIERQGIIVFEQDPGINYSLSFSWSP